MSLIDMLSEIGYKLSSHGYYYTTNSLYRQGQDPTSLTIYPDKNLVIDWVTGEKFNIEKLIALTLKTSSDQTKDWLKNKNVNIIKVEEEPRLTTQQTFPPEYLKELAPDHSYWINRGISKGVIERFQGGVCQSGSQKNRYVIPVFNKEKVIVGLCGRTLINSKIKYKINGCKNTFRFPLHLGLGSIKQKKRIVLVESQGDAVSLFEAGIPECLTLFGVSLSNEQLSTLIALNVKGCLNQIIISTNNDGAAGNEAAIKIYRRLLKFFDRKQVEIRLPVLKDLNLMLTETGVGSIKEMYVN